MDSTSAFGFRNQMSPGPKFLKSRTLILGFDAVAKLPMITFRGPGSRNHDPRKLQEGAETGKSVHATH
jgi:hypothetical protein